MLKKRTGIAPRENGPRARSLARRMALRDIKKNKSTSALILALIALPMMVMVLVATVLQSSIPTGEEKARMQLGGFDVQLVGVDYPVGAIQGPNDPWSYASYGEQEQTTGEADERKMLKQIPAQSTSTTVRSGNLGASAVEGLDRLEISLGNFSDPRFAGRYELIEGNWGTGDSVVINQDLAEATKLGIGNHLKVSGTNFPISGIAKNSSGRGKNYTGLGLSLGMAGFEAPGIFVASGHPVGKEIEQDYVSVFVADMNLDVPQLAELNALGIGGYSRDLMINPRAGNSWGGAMTDSERSEALVQFLGMFIIGFFVFLEVGLLAGAAFAVGAKKQRRTFALLAANGAEGATIRSTGIYSGFYLGGMGVLLGLALGLAGAWGIIAWAGFNDGGFPGWHIPWVMLVSLAALGLASAVIAALLPARTVSRNAASTALRANANAIVRPKAPLLGYAVSVLGLAGLAVATISGLSATTYGQLNDRSAIIFVGFMVGLVLCTIGLMLCLGRMLWSLGNLGHRLPLSGRLAVRDIQRNHGRTVPAIAAVIAGTALAAVLVIATGISTAAAGYTTKPSSTTVYDLYLPNGIYDSTPLDEIENEALAGKIIDQLTRAGYPPVATSRHGEMLAGVKNPGTDEAAVEQWLALLKPSSICRFGYEDIYSSSNPDTALLTARADAISQSVLRDADRFTVSFCGINGGIAAGVVQSPTTASVTDLEGLKLILGKNYTPALGDAFSKGQAIVTLPEYVTDDGRITFGKQDLDLPVLEQEDFNGSSYGAFITLPLERSFELEAVEALIPRSSAPSILMSKEAVVGTGSLVLDSTLLLDLGRTLDAEDLEAVDEDLKQFQVRLYPMSGFEDSNRLMASLPWLLAVAAALLVLTSAVMTTGLALADGRRDARAMDGVGAAPGTRRRFAAVQAGITASFGTVLGAILGTIPVVLLLLVMDGRFDVWLLAPLSVLLFVPLLAALIGGLMAPRRLTGARLAE